MEYKGKEITINEMISKINMEAGIIQHYANQIYMEEIHELNNPVITKLRGNIVEVKFPTKGTILSMCDNVVDEIELLLREYNSKASHMDRKSINIDEIYMYSVCKHATDIVDEFNNNLELIKKFYDLEEE